MNNTLLETIRNQIMAVPNAEGRYAALAAEIRSSGSASGTAQLSAAEKDYLAAHGVPEAAGLAAKENETKRKRMGL